jgi:hypothetical protein
MTTAATIYGTATIQAAVPLADLNIGELVLGTPSEDLPYRTLHRVTAPLGVHRVPAEELDSLLDRALDHVLRPGDRERGVLVDSLCGGNATTPAMFTEEHTPTLDRVVGGVSV